MAPPRFRRRLWIIAGFPLLAVLLTLATVEIVFRSTIRDWRK